MSAVERVLLHKKEAWLTSERLIINSEQINLNQIERAWVERLSLVVRLTDGEEERFGWESLALNNQMKQTGFDVLQAMAVYNYVHTQLDLWANTINRRIDYIKAIQKDK